jgi:hypothetical protein
LPRVLLHAGGAFVRRANSLAKPVTFTALTSPLWTPSTQQAELPDRPWLAALVANASRCVGSWFADCYRCHQRSPHSKLSLVSPTWFMAAVFRQCRHVKPIPPLFARTS